MLALNTSHVALFALIAMLAMIACGCRESIPSQSELSVAALLIDEGRLDEAIVSLHKLAARRPDHAPTLAQLGRAYALLNQYDLAFTAFKSALAADKEDIETLHALGRAYLEIHNLPASRETADQLQQYHPNAARTKDIEGRLAIATALDMANEAFEILGNKTTEPLPPDLHRNIAALHLDSAIADLADIAAKVRVDSDTVKLSDLLEKAKQRLVRAEELLTSAVEEDPSLPGTALVLANLSLDLGHLNYAESLYKTLQNTPKYRGEALLGLSRVAGLKGQEQKSSDMAKSAVAHTPRSVEAQMVLAAKEASEMGKTNERQDTTVYYSSLLRRTRLANAITLWPSRVAYVDALIDLDTSQDVGPNRTTSLLAEATKKWKNWGIPHYELAHALRLTEASDQDREHVVTQIVSSLSAALGAMPSFAPARAELAHIHFEQAEYLKQVLRKTSLRSTGFKREKTSNSMDRHYELALDQSRRGLERLPYDVPLRLILATTLAETRKYSEAQEQYEIAVAIASGQPASATGPFAMSGNLPRMQKVISNYRSRQEKSPSIVLSSFLAFAQLANKRPDLAIKEFEGILRKNSAYLFAHSQLARTLALHGEFEKAIKQYNLALDLTKTFNKRTAEKGSGPLYATDHLHVGLASSYRAQQQYREAIIQLFKAMQSADDTLEAHTALSQMMTTLAAEPPEIIRETLDTVARHLLLPVLEDLDSRYQKALQPIIKNIKAGIKFDDAFDATTDRRAFTKNELEALVSETQAAVMDALSVFGPYLSPSQLDKKLEDPRAFAFEMASSSAKVSFAALPESPNPCFRMGKISLLQQEPKAVLTWFRRAIQKDPTFTPAYAAVLPQIGGIAEEVHRFLPVLDKLGKNPKSHNAWRKQILSLKNQAEDRLREPIRTIEKGNRSLPGNPDFFMMSAIVNQLFHPAIATINAEPLYGKTTLSESAKVTATFPDRPYLHVCRANLYLSIGESERAKAIVMKCPSLRREHKQAYAHLVDHLQSEPDVRKRKIEMARAAWHLNMGIQYSRYGLHTLARRAFSSALREPLSGSHNLFVHSCLASVQSKTEHLARTRQLQQAILAANPDFATAHVQIARMFRHQAEQARLTARDLDDGKDPKQAEKALASIRKTERLESEAILSYRKAIAAAPDLHAARLELILMLEAQGKEVDAIRAYKTLLDEVANIDPDTQIYTDPDWLYAPNRTELFAIPLLARELSGSNDDLMPLMRLLYNQSDRLEVFPDDLEKALLTSLNQAGLRFRLASLYEHSGQPEKALMQYQMALGQDPNLPESTRAEIAIKKLSSGNRFFNTELR